MHYKQPINFGCVLHLQAPMLSKILSFPTLLILDKKGKVREIHTGFSGPGTGKYYDKFVSDFYGLMEKLLAE